MSFITRILTGLFKRGGYIRIKELPPEVEKALNAAVKKVVEETIARLFPKKPPST